jgi:hypothetical protein
MEKNNLLQRPGGLGPMNTMQPLGGTGTESPAAYAVTPEMIAVRRAAGMDNINRVMAQYSRDRGETVRAAVGPTNYQEGNIMPSMQATGPAGYQHRDPLVLPDRPADMTKAEYLVKEQNSMNPDLRAKMQVLTTMPQQNFYNVQDVSTSLMTQDYRTPASLPLQRFAGERMRNRGK